MGWCYHLYRPVYTYVVNKIFSIHGHIGLCDFWYVHIPFNVRYIECFGPKHIPSAVNIKHMSKHDYENMGLW